MTFPALWPGHWTLTAGSPIPQGDGDHQSGRVAEVVPGAKIVERIPIGRIEPLSGQVKRVHVGTHSADIEDGLRQLFSSHGWKNVNDYRCLSVNQTPYGEIKFGDGVQTWVNAAV